MLFDKLKKSQSDFSDVVSSNDILEIPIPDGMFYYIQDCVKECSNDIHVKNDSDYYTIALTYNSGIENIPTYDQYNYHIPCGINGRDDIYRFSDYNSRGLFLKNIVSGTVLKGKITIAELPFNSEWHYDEPLEQAVKCIIPIDTTTDYKFQMDNMTPVHLKSGYLYCFDASNYHRFISECIDGSVIHLVFSVASNFILKDNVWNYQFLSNNLMGLSSNILKS